MSLLLIQGIKLSYGDRELLKDVTCSLNLGDRLSLVGANGCGKTTLLNIVAGMAEPDSGSIVKKKGLRLSYLPQTGLTHKGKSLLDELETAFSEYSQLLVEVDRIGDALQVPDIPESRMRNLLEEYHSIQEHIQHSGYYSRGMQIQSVMNGLGFSEKDGKKDCSAFSGGWQMRIGLAKVLLRYPDVLLLDEPTNYLDLDAREWLRNFILSFHGATILVSHDRSFLDETITGVAELYQGKVKVYPGTYSAYESKRSLELEQILAAWKKQQDEIAHLESFVERFRYKASKATQAQSRVKQLEKIDRIEIPEGLRKVDFKFPEAPPSSELMLSVEEISKTYGTTHAVLKDVSFSVHRGERLAILGRNGAGKSTLMRLLSGSDVPTTGSIATGHKVKIGYFAQDAENSLDPESTVFEEVERDVPDIAPQMLRNLLGAFLFSGDDIDKQIKILSGGEKSRVSLLKLLLSPANLLILDEPTNHLDLGSKAVLLRAMSQFSGAIIFVSHDKQFVKELATCLIDLKADPSGGPSRFTRYLGDWTYYEWKTAQSRSESDIRTKLTKSETTSTEAESYESDARMRRESGKNVKTRLKKLEREEAALFERLSAIESELTSKHQAMAEPEVYKNPDKLKALRQLVESLDAEQKQLDARWETMSAEIETLKKESLQINEPG